MDNTANLTKVLEKKQIILALELLNPGVEAGHLENKHCQ